MLDTLFHYPRVIQHHREGPFAAEREQYSAEQRPCTMQLANGIAGPRLFAQASVPSGPKWCDVQRLIAATATNRQLDIRDQASLLLLSIGCCPHHGPHALRHACATHLVAEGLTLKQIGVHFGHRVWKGKRHPQREWVKNISKLVIFLQ